MKPDFELSALLSFLADQGMVLDSRQAEQLQSYLILLRNWSLRMNLVSQNDRALLVERHILPAFFYAFEIAKLKKKHIKILDLGSGAGLPGVPVSLFFPKKEIWLLDSSRKKQLFLKKVVGALGINAVAVCNRVEKLALKNTERFDVVVARSVASLNTLSAWGRGVLKEQGVFFTLKGRDYREEYKNNKLAAVRLKEIEPPKAWLRFSRFLEGKIMIKLEY